MANEALITAHVRIFSGSFDYQSKPRTYQADVATPPKGPSPGAFTVDKTGVDVDLSEVTAPGGICVIQNLDADYMVTYGTWDPDTETFYPFGELLAGEVSVFRLSRQVEEEVGTGSGSSTTGANTNRFRFKSEVQDINVRVDAFNK